MIPSEPKYNPVLPFTDTIIGGLSIGSLVTINGAISNSAKSFQINLACGSNFDGKSPVRSPIAFHFNPRFNQRYVARNTFLQSKWGAEESEAPQKYFPFATGQKFEMMILVATKEFKVAINGQHFISYAHRIAINNINTLNIQGDAIIEKIMLENLKPTPSEIGSAKPILEAIYEPKIPLSHKIPQGMSPGRVIYISGKPLPYRSRFSIDLTCGDPSKTMENIALHFNPRFFPTTEVVRNTLLGGKWGEEECESNNGFPFERSISFDVKICCEEERFVVFVNGSYFCPYNHRIPYEVISKLTIEGDVIITSVIFQ